MSADPTAIPYSDDLHPFTAAMRRLDDPARPGLPQFHPAHRDRFDALTEMLEPATVTRVAVVEQLYLLQTPRPWVPSIVHAVAGNNVFGEPWLEPRPASIAEIAAADPAVIVFAVPGADLYRTQIHVGRLLQNPQWRDTVDGRRVIALDGNQALHRAGPELMASLELLAWALHRPDERLRPNLTAGAERLATGWRDLAGFDTPT